MNYNPTVWHINEGHAAFSLLERIRELVAVGTDFDTALEQIAAATIFTTHTPVSAGHDRFNQATLLHHLGSFISKLEIDIDILMALGTTPSNPHDFNMTTLGLRGSRFHNGVSLGHRGVTAAMEAEVWPQIPPAESPITYITNGVHIESFLDKEWVDLFDRCFNDWRQHLSSVDYWQCINTIDNQTYWQCHQSVKKSLLNLVRRQVTNQHTHNGASQALIAHSTRYIDQYQENLLVLGFARRFATYKRATLLFYDHQRLLELLNHDPPILIIFAGKAHPDDGPGKELIRIVHEYSLQPELIGKIIILEGYDMALARLMVGGCDVWLNTLEYPMEACGTSGQKAGINGVVNLSVLDGWWAEGFNSNNGWAIAPHAPETDSGFRNRQESADLLDILEHGVIPDFFNHEDAGYPKQWVQKSKASMSSVIPHFSAERMLSHYVKQLYREEQRQGARLSIDNNAGELSRWKQLIRTHWPGVRAKRIDTLQN